MTSRSTPNQFSTQGYLAAEQATLGRNYSSKTDHRRNKKVGVNRQNSSGSLFLQRASSKPKSNIFRPKAPEKPGNSKAYNLVGEQKPKSRLMRTLGRVKLKKNKNKGEFDPSQFYGNKTTVENPMYTNGPGRKQSTRKDSRALSSVDTMSKFVSQKSVDQDFLTVTLNKDKTAKVSKQVNLSFVPDISNNFTPATVPSWPNTLDGSMSKIPILVRNPEQRTPPQNKVEKPAFQIEAPPSFPRDDAPPPPPPDYSFEYEEDQRYAYEQKYFPQQELQPPLMQQQRVPPPVPPRSPRFGGYEDFSDVPPPNPMYQEQDWRDQPPPPPPPPGAF
eukprot:maker-scaffold_15-snap-gene-9.63-mRNA-1 protein AED:0.00 eAED:0.00 QI:104/1/1/1/1/1/2/235/330